MKRIVIMTLLAFAMLLGITSAATAAPPALAGYIVVLHDNVESPAAAAREIAAQVGGQVGYVYEHALKGFSILVPAQAVAALERNPNVKYVATDDIRYAYAQEIPTGIERIFADENSKLDIDGTDDYRVDVDVAVIDTGVDFEHPDLNVMGGVNCTGNPFKSKCVSGGDDDHYHGTHVAGTIGALDNDQGVVGVAPGARLWAVKVLNSRGSGYTSWIVAGIDWVAANADTIEVANMSLGGAGFNQAEYDAIQGAVNKGVAFAVAAGNSDDDAGNYSPAAFDNVLTVSALADFDGEPGGLGSPTCRTDQDDTLADFSNWGPAVDIAAPGVCILSTFPLEQGEYGTISGTSMASPHVAGALALLASASKLGNATDVYNLYDQVINSGNSNWTDDSGDGSKEPLLDVSTFSPTLIPVVGEPPAPNNPPTVGITSPTEGASFASGESISFAGSASDTEDGDLTGSLVWTSSLYGQIGTGGSFSATLSNGTHTISASVTDSEGLTASESITITVSGATAISLTAQAYKERGTGYADLTWTEATTNVDVYRDGSVVETTEYGVTSTQLFLGKGGGSATLWVCESQTSICSNIVTVSW
ncbi:MAG: S8 family serine peptidase [Desulfatiglandales bacterium]